MKALTGLAILLYFFISPWFWWREGYLGVAWFTLFCGFDMLFTVLSGQPKTTLTQLLIPGSGFISMYRKLYGKPKLPN